MALEVVQSLQGELDSDRQLEAIEFPEVDFTALFDSLEKLLIEKAKELKSNAGSSFNLDRAKQELEKHCNDNLISLKLQELSEKIILEQMELVNSLLLIAAKTHLPQQMVRLMNQIYNKTLKQRKQAQKIAQESYTQEGCAWSAYGRIRGEDDIEAAWKAIVEAQKAALKGEYYQIFVAQLFLQIESSCKMYLVWAKGSSNIIANMKSSLESKLPTQVTQLPIFSRIDRLDIEDQRKRLEVWVNYPVTRWGYSPVSWQQIQERLMLNLEKPARAIFEEFSAEFIKVVEIKESSTEVNGSVNAYQT